MNPVTIPIIIRKKKNPATLSIIPMKKTEVAIPKPVISRIGLKPYLSPIRPHKGETINAVRKVIPNTKPDHLWTYSVLKSPNVLI